MYRRFCDYAYQCCPLHVGPLQDKPDSDRILFVGSLVYIPGLFDLSDHVVPKDRVFFKLRPHRGLLRSCPVGKLYSNCQVDLGAKSLPFESYP